MPAARRRRLASTSPVRPMLSHMVVVAATLLCALTAGAWFAHVSGEVPDVAVAADEGEDTLMVVGAPSGLKASDVAIQSSAPIALQVEGQAPWSLPAAYAAWLDPSGSARGLGAGTAFKLCGGSLAAGALQRDVEVRLLDATSGATLATTHFDSLAPCGATVAPLP